MAPSMITSTPPGLRCEVRRSFAYEAPKATKQTTSSPVHRRSGTHRRTRKLGWGVAFSAAERLLLRHLRPFQAERKCRFWGCFLPFRCASEPAHQRFHPQSPHRRFTHKRFHALPLIPLGLPVIPRSYRVRIVPEPQLLPPCLTFCI